VLAGAPRPVALIGFDDFELADQLAVPVTVVAYDAGDLGRQAARLIFERLSGDQAPPREVIVATRLVARGSGEIAPPP
jgi:LacI family transcriptional regulator